MTLPDPDAIPPGLIAKITKASNEIYKRTVRGQTNWIRVEVGSTAHGMLKRMMDPSAVDLLGDLVRGSSTTS